MSIFSGNRAHQFYVTKSVSDSLATIGASTFKGIGAATSAPEIVYQQLGYGGPVRSDLIKVSTISNIRVTKGSALKKPLRNAVISLKSTYINNTNVNTTTLPVGTACIARVTFYQYGAISIEDQLTKIASATVASAMTLEEFYIALRDNLTANFGNEQVPTLSFSLYGAKASATLSDNAGITVTANSAGTAGNSLQFEIDSITETWVENEIPGKVTVTVSEGITTITVGLQSTHKTIADLKAIIAAYPEVAALITITGTDATACVVEAPAVALTGGSTTGVTIQEIAQPFALGKKSSQPLYFKIESTSSDIVHSSGPVTIETLAWADITELEAVNYISATYDIAEREYFYHGERGDIYRGMGWPNNMDTQYLVDLTKSYNLIDMDFYYTDGGLHPQESKKHITIACEESSETSYTVTNALIAVLETTSGLTISDLS